MKSETENYSVGRDVIVHQSKTEGGDEGREEKKLPLKVIIYPQEEEEEKKKEHNVCLSPSV